MRQDVSTTVLVLGSHSGDMEPQVLVIPVALAVGEGVLSGCDAVDLRHGHVILGYGITIELYVIHGALIQRIVSRYILIPVEGEGIMAILRGLDVVITNGRSLLYPLDVVAGDIHVEGEGIGISHIGVLKGQIASVYLELYVIDISRRILYGVIHQEGSVI